MTLCSLAIHLLPVLTRVHDVAAAAGGAGAGAGVSAAEGATVDAGQASAVPAPGGGTALSLCVEGVGCDAQVDWGWRSTTMARFTLSRASARTCG